MDGSQTRLLIRVKEVLFYILLSLSVCVSLCLSLSLACLRNGRPP